MQRVCTMHRRVGFARSGAGNATVLRPRGTVLREAPGRNGSLTPRVPGLMPGERTAVALSDAARGIVNDCPLKQAAFRDLKQTIFCLIFL